ncbi:hypothetical protein C8R42DRAFT_674543 [Lentinula raphanica]|nr:hypothetical protein C8R42DRAFT_674543 [Lentinula raphanica]
MDIKADQIFCYVPHRNPSPTKRVQSTTYSRPTTTTMCTVTISSTTSSSCVSHNAQHESTSPSVTSPVLSMHSVDAKNVPNNYSRPPQCGHCGWRGDHAPNCPFRS